MYSKDDVNNFLRDLAQARKGKLEAIEDARAARAAADALKAQLATTAAEREAWRAIGASVPGAHLAASGLAGQLRGEVAVDGTVSIHVMDATTGRPRYLVPKGQKEARLMQVAEALAELRSAHPAVFNNTEIEKPSGVTPADEAAGLTAEMKAARAKRAAQPVPPLSDLERARALRENPFARSTLNLTLAGRITKAEPGLATTLRRQAEAAGAAVL